MRNDMNSLHNIGRRNGDLYAIANKLYHNDFDSFFQVNKKRNNGILYYEFKCEKNYPGYEWLIKRICIIGILKMINANASDSILELISSPDNIVDKIVLYERKAVELLTGSSHDTNEALYVSLYTASYSPEENTYYGKSKTDCIDLDQNTCVTVLESDEKEKMFEYCHNGKVLYTYTYLNGELPDYVEWIEQGKSEEEYSELLNRMTISELHLLDTGNSKDIVLGTDIAFPGVNAYSYDQFVWHDSDRLYLYNIDLGTTESIEVPGIIHSEVFDRHILFITRSADEKTGLYVTDTKDMKQITVIESVGLNDHITFSIIFETENGFFGICNDALCWMKKTDYYQGSFEKSVYMGAI